MKETSGGVTVNIFGKEFMISCPENEREALLAAAGYLDKKMREIHNAGKVIGAERCAIMAGLNIANELLDLKRHGGMSLEAVQKLRFLQGKIDAVLGRDAQALQ